MATNCSVSQGGFWIVPGNVRGKGPGQRKSIGHVELGQDRGLILINISGRTRLMLFGQYPMGVHMKLLMIASFTSLTVNVAATQEMSYGQAEYLNSCAVCHGVDGKGDGPLRDALMKRPSDLTHLSERNGGTFPYSRVFAIIDGRYGMPSHGTREMPVWGRQFLEDDEKIYGSSGGEIVTTERIHNLTTYIGTLQH